MARVSPTFSLFVALPSASIGCRDLCAARRVARRGESKHPEMALARPDAGCTQRSGRSPPGPARRRGVRPRGSEQGDVSALRADSSPDPPAAIVSASRAASVANTRVPTTELNDQERSRRRGADYRNARVASHSGHEPHEPVALPGVVLALYCQQGSATSARMLAWSRCVSALIVRSRSVAKGAPGRSSDFLLLRCQLALPALRGRLAERTCVSLPR
jgi:hypothetical protein